MITIVIPSEARKLFRHHSFRKALITDALTTDRHFEQEGFVRLLR